jgi:DNA-binding HxlR family transcriptional regulator
MALPPDVMSDKCASRGYMTLLASRWSLLIIKALGNARRRNGDLMREIEGISQKMLTQTLRELEHVGIVARHDLGTIPPHVEYELTPLGRSLRREVASFILWVETHMPEFGQTASRKT